MPTTEEIIIIVSQAKILIGAITMISALKNQAIPQKRMIGLRFLPLSKQREPVSGKARSWRAPSICVISSFEIPIILSQ